jgi:DNA gyrase/topoisomerase IV subunit B
MKDEKQQPVTTSFTPEQLAQLLKTVVEEVKKPTQDEIEAREAKIAEQKAKELEREVQAGLVRDGLKKKQLEQQYCSHKHEDNKPRVAYITNGNYFLCLFKQCRIYPDTHPQLFNEFMQAFNTKTF